MTTLDHRQEPEALECRPEPDSPEQRLEPDSPEHRTGPDSPEHRQATELSEHDRGQANPARLRDGSDLGRPDNPDQLREKVRNGYARIARREDRDNRASGSGGGCCGPSSCCGSSASSVDGFAESIGYSVEELASLPEGANLGLSCGNPTALASVRLGEIVLDLGSGGGFDVFLAGPKVGPTGRAVGVDMTPEMLARARRNTRAYTERTGLDNVEFRLGEIEHLPVADASVDVVISNCVINLSPDKPRVWSEIARVLKPGGRVAVSDLALLRPLPDRVRRRIEAWVGCVAGACLVEEIRGDLEAAGLTGIVLKEKPDYLKASQEMKDPVYQEIQTRLDGGAGLSDYVVSLDISAVKP
jgi:arsenite methyltransferase